MFKKTRDCFSQYHWVSVTVLELAGNTKLPFRTLVSIAWTLRAGHNNAIGPDITRAGCEWDRRHWPQPTVSSRILSFWFTESSVLSFWISHTVCKPSRNFPVKKKNPVLYVGSGAYLPHQNLKTQYYAHYYTHLKMWGKFNLHINPRKLQADLLRAPSLQFCTNLKKKLPTFVQTYKIHHHKSTGTNHF